MSNRYHEDSLIEVKGRHPAGFPAFTAGLATALRSTEQFLRPDQAVVDLPDGRVVIDDDGADYSIGFVSYYESDDEVTTPVDEKHNAFVHRVHDAAAAALPGVTVELLDQHDDVIRTITRSITAA